MSVTEPLARRISELLTWREICERYPDQWVCLVDIEYVAANAAAIACARVVGHGKSKGEPVQQAKAWWGVYATIGHFYTGTLRAPERRIWVEYVDDDRDAIHPR